MRKNKNGTGQNQWPGKIKSWWGSKKNQKNVLGLALLLAVCVALSLTGRSSKGLLFLFDRSGADGREAEVYEKERLKAMQESADRSAFSFRINGNISFETGSSEGILFIENPEDNDCLLKVTITLDDDGRVLYETGYLRPGTGIGKGRLKETLTAGEYEATAEFVACDKKRNETGRALAGVHITIRS